MGAKIHMRSGCHTDMPRKQKFWKNKWVWSWDWWMVFVWGVPGRPKKKWVEVDGWCYFFQFLIEKRNYFSREFTGCEDGIQYKWKEAYYTRPSEYIHENVDKCFEDKLDPKGPCDNTEALRVALSQLRPIRAWILPSPPRRGGPSSGTRHRAPPAPDREAYLLDERPPPFLLIFGMLYWVARRARWKRD